MNQQHLAKNCNFEYREIKNKTNNKLTTTTKNETRTRIIIKSLKLVKKMKKFINFIFLALK